MATLQQDIDWLVREKYGGKFTAAAKRDIERLRNGEHVDYVIGFANFLGCVIDLTARPLIPRPETEFWTERAIADINRHSADPLTTHSKLQTRVLDLFAGSGCIGISVLKHCRKVRVDFADIESRYFAGIRKSARQNDISPGRMRCIQSDIFEDLPFKGYSYILANPPYIRTAGRAIQRSVIDQEPRTALFGGKDGLRFIRKLIKEAKEHLALRGTLIVEFDPPQKKEIGLLADRLGYESEFFRDQYSRSRFVFLRTKWAPT